MHATKSAAFWTRIIFGLALPFVGSTAIAAAAELGDEPRVSESKFFAAGARDQANPDRVSTDSFDAAAESSKGTRGRQKLNGADAQSRSPNTDFWIYTADVELFADEDRDGYYHGIDLYFDADTIYAHAEVFAVVYLSLEGGPWVEYAETETFSIFGATSDDDYVIVTELLAGYPTGSYDVLIELFDTWDNSFVADFGPENTSELAYLPLEDADRDAPNVGGGTVVVNRGGGGASGWTVTLVLGLLVLASAGLRRRPLVRTARVRRRGPSA